MKTFIKDLIEIFSILLCNHHYVSKNVSKITLHTKLECRKCGKVKYKFEG